MSETETSSYRGFVWITNAFSMSTMSSNLFCRPEGPFLQISLAFLSRQIYKIITVIFSIKRSQLQSILHNIYNIQESYETVSGACKLSFG